MAFLPGITVVRATPSEERASRELWGETANPPRRCTSVQKPGVALTTSTPLVRRAVTPGEGGTREAQPRFALSQRTREIRVVPRLMRRFVKVSYHNGKGSAL